MKEILLEVISKYINDKKVIRNRWHRFTKMNSYLAKMAASYDEMIGSVDRERTLGIVDGNFSKAFDTVL